MKNIDYSLYLVTDRALSKGRSLFEIIKSAVKGGVTVVQLREKDCSTREFLEIAQEVKNFCSPLGVPLIINDRVDIALAVAAEGLHIGQSDMPYEIARKLMGSDAIIGLSVESVEDALEAEKMDVDYLGLSPIYSTATKTDIDHELGLEGIREIRKISRHPLIAIGGINLDNIAKIIAAGADGIAVVSAICSAEDPKAASQELLKQVKSGKK
ncbi:MAG: thiamine phosphate synthase [Candidatus Neomarinimicrobiota bacterium]